MLNISGSITYIYLKNSSFLALTKDHGHVKAKFFLGDNDFNLDTFNKNIDNAVQTLNNAKLVVFPTETVYGLGVKGINLETIKFYLCFMS